MDYNQHIKVREYTERFRKLYCEKCPEKLEKVLFGKCSGKILGTSGKKGFELHCSYRVNITGEHVWHKKEYKN
jgi:hypothetical protein